MEKGHNPSLVPYAFWDFYHESFILKLLGGMQLRSYCHRYQSFVCYFYVFVLKSKQMKHLMAVILYPFQSKQN